MSDCQHPPERLYSWFADDPGGKVLCIACNECGAVLKGGAQLEPICPIHHCYLEGNDCPLCLDEKTEYEGYFENGDQWTGEREVEDGVTYYTAVDAKNGNQLYVTAEMPTRYPLFTMVRFEGHWTEQMVKEYFKERQG